MNIRIMQLYKEKNLNPFSGCLPLIIQIPILLAFFSLLKGGRVFTGDSTFLGWSLAGIDTTYIFPVLNTAFMVLSNRKSLTSSDSLVNNKQMIFFNIAISVMLFFASLNFPVGVHIYMLSSSIFGLIQDLIFSYLFK